MKKIVSAILALLLMLGGLPVYAESSQTAVEIPCEYVIENHAHHGTVAGIVKDGLAYVSLETVKDLTGTMLLEEDGYRHLVLERLWTHWSLEIASGTLTEESIYYDKKSWEIPTLTMDGETLVSLEHMLCAMGCRYSWNPGTEYPLSVYKPYTYFDALLEVNQSGVFFEWAELGSAGGDEKLNYMLSAFGSLIMDYDSHLVSDALFSWISDDILNAPEEQWRDAMYTVLTCLDGADLESINSEAIESLELEGDGLSLGLDTLELMGITGGELEKIGGALEITDYLSIPLETLDAYLNFRKVNEGQVDMLKTVFLTPRSGSYLDEGTAAHLRPAARNLQNLIEGDAEAWTSDVAVEFATKIATMTVDNVVPIFAILDATKTLIKLLPPAAELVEANQYINLGISCDAQSKLARAELLSLKDEIRSRNGDLQSIEDSQKILAYALRASYAARKCFLESGTLDDTITAGLRERNQALLTMILKVETAEAVLPADTLEVFINWEEAAAQYQKPQYDPQNLVIERDRLEIGTELGVEVFCIPEICLPYEEVQTLSGEIRQRLMERYETALNTLPNPSWGGSEYFWVVNENVLSLVIRLVNAPMASPWDEFLTYNIDITTGALLSATELAGAEAVAYMERLSSTVEAIWMENWEATLSYGSSGTDMLAKTLSTQNLDQAVPFRNSQGEMCVALNFYFPVANGQCGALVNLETGDLEKVFENQLLQ